MTAMRKQGNPDTSVILVGTSVSLWYIGGRHKPGWLIYSYSQPSHDKDRLEVSRVEVYLLVNGKFAQISNGGIGHSIPTYDQRLIDNLEKLLRRYGVE